MALMPYEGFEEPEDETTTAPADPYAAPVYEPVPAEAPTDPYSGYNYDTQGNYGAGYPPP
jgi:hypothetical protein